MPSGNGGTGTSGFSNKGFCNFSIHSSRLLGVANGGGCWGIPSGRGGNLVGFLRGSRAVDRRGSTPLRKVVKTSEISAIVHGKSFLELD